MPDDQVNQCIAVDDDGGARLSGRAGSHLDFAVPAHAGKECAGSYEGTEPAAAGNGQAARANLLFNGPPHEQGFASTAFLPIAGQALAQRKVAARIAKALSDAIAGFCPGRGLCWGLLAVVANPLFYLLNQPLLTRL